MLTYTYATYATYFAAVLVLWSVARLCSKRTEHPSPARGVSQGAGPLLTKNSP